MRSSIGTLLYVIVGIVLASDRGYLVNLGSLSNIISAILAVALWPLLLIGVNLHIAFATYLTVPR